MIPTYIDADYHQWLRDRVSMKSMNTEYQTSQQKIPSSCYLRLLRDMLKTHSGILTTTGREKGLV
jgi:hypothetical protein